MLPWGLELGIWDLSLLDPLHRFLRQFVEGGNGECEMLLFRVLDFIVADPAEHTGKKNSARSGSASFNRLRLGIR